MTSLSAFMKAADDPGRELKSSGFKVYTAAEAAKKADIIMILINDEKQADMYKKDIEPKTFERRQYAYVCSWFQHSFRIYCSCKERM